MIRRVPAVWTYLRSHSRRTTTPVARAELSVGLAAGPMPTRDASRLLTRSVPSSRMVFLGRDGNLNVSALF